MEENWKEIKELKIPVSDEAAKVFLGQVEVEGKRLCVVRYREKWYAMNAKCPHANGPLAGGYISEDGKIVCPWHRFAYDLKTGQSDSGGYFLNMYDTRQKKDGSLWVKFKKKPWYKFW